MPRAGAGPGARHLSLLARILLMLGAVVAAGAAAALAATLGPWYGPESEAERLLVFCLAGFLSLVEAPYFLHRAAAGAQSWYGELVFVLWGYGGAAWLLGWLVPSAGARRALALAVIAQVVLLWGLCCRRGGFRGKPCCIGRADPAGVRGAHGGSNPQCLQRGQRRREAGRNRV